MYDAIESIIAHSWVNNYTSDQQYIYYICGAVIILFVCFTFNVIQEIINAVRGRR